MLPIVKLRIAEYEDWSKKAAEKIGPDCPEQRLPSVLVVVVNTTPPGDTLLIGEAR